MTFLCSGKSSSAFLWIGLAGYLFAWNGLAAMHASPLVLTHRWDGTQYQLLARNQLRGHYEVGDAANTVRREGQHPMFRPALVWLQHGLALVLGGVQPAAILASVLGTSLLELLLVALAWQCFGRWTALVVVFCLVMPLTVAAQFLMLAVGQGPELWAAAAIVAGLAILVKALGRQSWPVAGLAGVVAGLAEWFRTGNHLLFGIPCLVYLGTALWQKQWRRAVVTLSALGSFFLMIVSSGFLTPTAVNKTVANFRHRLVEHQGARRIEESPGGHRLTVYLGGLELSPGTRETYYDSLLQTSRGPTALEIFQERSEEIFAVYAEGLGQVLESDASGLRQMLGETPFLFFFIGVSLAVVRRQAADAHTLAFAAGGLAHYLGPVVLFRGAEPTHYFLVALPLFVIVACRGLAHLGDLASLLVVRYSPDRLSLLQRIGWASLVLLAVPALCLMTGFYRGALADLSSRQAVAEEQQAAVDALPLQGYRIACRDMSWFVHRDVETVLFPYAHVRELEKYVLAQHADGLLIWANDPHLLFRAVPYRSFKEFDRAMRESRVFGPVRISGEWYWYPVSKAS
jgi:hypothetical protein